MKEKFSIKPKIMELNDDSNDIYMTLNICILSNDVNYNNAQFLDDFIDGIINNKEQYIGIPFLVNREKIENGEYDDLSHELQDGQLLTDQIGSFVNFWKEEIDDANCLMGSIRVMKRFPNTCNAIIELYNENKLETSCEVLVNKYEEVTEDGIRKIGYNNGKNTLIGSALVTNPAEYRASATLLVAEAYKKDINKKGDVEVSEQFNKGIDVKYYGELETASLKFSEVRDQIYNKLNPISPQNGYRKYNYAIRDLRVDYVVVEDWEDEDTLYKIQYTIQNDEVILSPNDQWIKGKAGFIPDGIDIDNLQTQITELNNKIDELKKEGESQMNKTVEELQTELSNKETEISDFKKQIDKLETKVTELNATIVSQTETKTTLGCKISELNSKVEELSPFKEKVEKAEKEVKVSELSNKYEKILSEKVFKSDDVQKALTELNEAKLMEIVVAEVQKEKTLDTKDKKDEEVVTIVASKQEDLLPKDQYEYWASPRS